MTDIEKLLEKYSDDVYSVGMYETPEQHQRRDKNNSVRKRLQMFEDLLLREPNLYLNKFEKEQVQYYIRKYPNFKELCKNAKEETIILAFMFYTKLSCNSHINFNTWSVCREYGLNYRTYSLIITNLLRLVSKDVPLSITSTTRYDHSILEKNSL